MIQDHKAVCRKLAPEGWAYTGYDTGFYCFQTGNYSKGFSEMKLLECDLTKENIEFMVKNNLTR